MSTPFKRLQNMYKNKPHDDTYHLYADIIMGRSSQSKELLPLELRATPPQKPRKRKAVKRRKTFKFSKAENGWSPERGGLLVNTPGMNDFALFYRYHRAAKYTRIYTRRIDYHAMRKVDFKLMNTDKTHVWQFRRFFHDDIERLKLAQYLVT